MTDPVIFRNNVSFGTETYDILNSGAITTMRVD
jgi:hypothetical protein